jgi:hypothetical protein
VQAAFGVQVRARQDQACEDEAPRGVRDAGGGEEQVVDCAGGGDAGPG